MNKEKGNLDDGLRYGLPDNSDSEFLDRFSMRLDNELRNRLAVLSGEVASAVAALAKAPAKKPRTKRPLPKKLAFA